jgi:hypothetical protein
MPPKKIHFKQVPLAVVEKKLKLKAKPKKTASRVPETKKT